MTPLEMPSGQIYPLTDRELLKEDLSRLSVRKDDADIFDRVSRLYAKMNDRSSALTFTLKTCDLFIDQGRIVPALDALVRAIQLGADVLDSHRRMSRIQDYIRSKPEAISHPFVRDLFEMVPSKELLDILGQFRSAQISPTSPVPRGELGTLAMVSRGVAQRKNRCGHLPVFLAASEVCILTSDDPEELRSATVDPLMIVLADRSVFEPVMRTHPKLKRRFELSLRQQGHLDQILTAPAFQSLISSLSPQLAPLLNEVALAKDEALCNPDHPFFHNLFVIVEGTAAVQENRVTQALQIGDLLYPPLMRRRELLFRTDLKAVMIHRKDFKTLFRSVPELPHHLRRLSEPLRKEPVVLEALVSTTTVDTSEAPTGPTRRARAEPEGAAFEPEITIEEPPIEEIEPALEENELRTEPLLRGSLPLPEILSSPHEPEEPQLAGLKDPLSFLQGLFKDQPTQSIEPMGRLFERSEVADHLYWVESGEVSVFTYDNYGRRNDLRELRAPFFIGEEFLFSHGVRAATAICLSRCEVRALSAVRIVEQCQRDPHLELFLKQSFNERTEFYHFCNSALFRGLPLALKNDYFQLGKLESKVQSPFSEGLGVIIAGSVYRYGVGSRAGSVVSIFGPGSVIGEGGWFYANSSESLRPGNAPKVLWFSAPIIKTLIRSHPDRLLELTRLFLSRQLPDVFQAVARIEADCFGADFHRSEPSATPAT